jgi:hypothetical protein
VIEQGTAQWLSEKLGAITSTRAHSVFGTPKVQKTLIRNIAVEIALAAKKPIIQTAPMRKGIEDEPLALAAYRLTSTEPLGEIVTGEYLYSDLSPLIADSPDVLIGEKGVIEIKNPSPEVHYEVLDSGIIPVAHFSQCIWHLMVSKREWCDYFSYCKELPLHLRSFKSRITCADIGFYEKKALKFVDSLVEHLTQKGLAL